MFTLETYLLNHQTSLAFRIHVHYYITKLPGDKSLATVHVQGITDIFTLGGNDQLFGHVSCLGNPKLSMKITSYRGKITC